jgi:diguanylate cyclase (GGDEF)-like protein
MLGFKRNSIAYKATISYLILTILNVSLFTFMIFENQLDLISENTLLQSESKSTNIRIKMDAILQNKKSISPEVIAQVQKEFRYLGIKEFAIFQEDCEIINESKNGKTVGKKRKSSKKEISCVIKSIQKLSFENRIFYHDLNRKAKIISLYVPISFGLDKTVVVKAVLSLKSVADKMKNLIVQCVIIGVLVVFIHIISAIFLLRTIINPILELSRATARIARGELKSRVNIIRRDEIGDLAISFNEMSVALERMREQALGANPLTGLPGNINIAQEIDRRLQSGEETAVVYSDLDNFKAYNDKYGFTRGDDVILYTRDCFVEALKLHPDQHIFLGHEGGDDFIMAMPYGIWEPFCKTVISLFDHDITQFYNATDVRNGYIDSISRQGERMRFPIMTISLAVTSNHLRRFQSHVEMVSVATEMKKVAKKIEGSSYAMDRRRE